MTRNRYRLDRHVQPQAYDLTLTPDFQRFTFTGRETIRLRAARPFRTLTLHALELKITQARLHERSSTPAQAPERITYDAALETATLHFKHPIRPSASLALELAFEGTMNDKMCGFYRTSYDVRGKRQWGGATQFEATDARRAFPCWDEPDCKATFTLTLRVPRALTALSNMPLVRQRRLPGTGLKALRYAPTPRMSTYLLAWVMADLECVQARDRDGILIRIWTTKGRRAQGRFALSVGVHALPYFAHWFGIPYALPKLDMVALPDFASGAMENWGLVTYRETALLVDPAHSSAPAKQRVAEVIAHELAHQWFGNLVTMGWWTDLWLNEGFASYMGPKAVDDQFPEWQIWQQYVAGEYLGALHEDSLQHTHPIEIPVQNPHEIREIFDSITYSKGSAVNRMLEHYLTEPVFRKGLSIYLKRYAYRNAATGDLWAVLEEVSGKPVRAIMASFTKRPGYPLLSVAAAGRGRWRLTQRRFLASGRPASAHEDQPWSVPVVASAAGESQPRYALLRARSAIWRAPASAAWIKLNTGQSGFYRTAYAPSQLAALVAALAGRQLPSLDALGLLDDVFALAQAGHLRTSQALDVLNNCRRYTDYHLWLTIAGSLQAIERLLPPGATQRQLWQVGHALIAAQARQLGWEAQAEEGHLQALLRALLLGRMGHYQDAATMAEARRRFQAFARGSELAPNLRSAVYGIVAEHGGRREYAQLLALYRRSPLQEERVRVLRALTQSQQPALIRRTLTLALSPHVRRQDAYVLLGGFGGNRAGRPIAWAFVKTHWPELVRRYASGGLNLMTRIVEGAAGGFTSASALADVSRFFAVHPVPGTERAMQRTLEHIRLSGRWARRDQADIARWLAQHV
jgi:puromycin-sensitive aminopeptidase